MPINGVRMPDAAPTRTPESIGRSKIDRGTPSEDYDIVSAVEYNRLCDELIACCQLVLELRLSGSVGTLQAAYNNYPGDPAGILLDSTRQGVEVRDSSVGIGSFLFRVAGKAGEDLLRVADADWTLATRGAAGTGLKSISNTGVRLVGSSGRNLEPSVAGLGTCGTVAMPWGVLRGLAHGTRLVQVAFGILDPVFDASAGSTQYIVMVGDKATLDITGGTEGQVLYLCFAQDVIGGRKITGDVGGEVWLAGGRKRLGLAPLAGAVTIVAFLCSLTSTGSMRYLEVGRYTEGDPHLGTASTDCATATTPQVLEPWADAMVQRYAGVLPGDFVINLTSTGALRGDQFRLEFDDAAGVVTDVAKRLIIQGDGAPLATFAAAGFALKGSIYATHDGGGWTISKATTYA